MSEESVAKTKPLEIGLMTLGDLLTDPTTGRRCTEGERHRHIVDQAVQAERLGFTAVHIGEHHFSDYIVSAPPVLLSAIGAKTTDLQLSTAVTLAGNLDPVRAAEDYATVDVLSGGRVEIVAGRGNLFVDTYAGFGHPVETARERYNEAVPLLNRLLREEDVHWDGQFRTPLTGHTTRPRPEGDLPLWIGAGSPESARLAAEIGGRLMLPTVFGTPEMFSPLVDVYRDRWAELDRPEAEAMIGACSHTHVSVNNPDAWSAYYGAYWEFVGTLLPEGAWPPFDFQKLLAGPGICGTPEQVKDRICSIRETLSLDRHLFMFDLGGMAPELVTETIELFGTEVMPGVD